MSISSVGLVQTLEPARPVNRPQPVSMPPDDRDVAAQRNKAEDEAREASKPPPEPGKGTVVDRSA
ncbi:hypothetical protein [uncultured Alsobacter sp.]|uniref:hypothetical protein n=1 Tax=uncultured Alsobacter sp. TaxID=1748258 RepID=UPI0025E1A935|nr:hypothetical protein [uncultured Alsobacter sp.]